ncbi:hypothetical protein EBZ39_00625 [bacterium]|nr:hypothetical protein [bacterium]
MPMTEARRRADPLNPVLYGLLEHKFGSVRIANEGVPALVDVIIDPVRRKPMKRASQWGEYYCVCCPFCNDQGHKLWVNHTYGKSHDERTGRRTDTHLAVCYKNSCLEVPGRYEQLEDIVFGAGRSMIKTMVIRQVAGDIIRHSIDIPGRIVGFDSLPDYHPAAEYLVSRGFDPLQLTAEFKVGVCTEVNNDRVRLMKGRIYIPVFFNRQLIGWQGRVVGDGLPKYYNSPGMQKSQVLYNYDAAVDMPAVVVVEGVPSVWRIGRAGVCLFGKTMSAWQSNTIATAWMGKPVFLMLDNDAQKEIDSGVTELCRHGVNVVPVLLPDSRDPADYTREELKQILREAADAVEVKVDLSFMD